MLFYFKNITRVVETSFVNWARGLNLYRWRGFKFGVWLQFWWKFGWKGELIYTVV